MKTFRALFVCAAFALIPAKLFATIDNQSTNDIFVVLGDIVDDYVILPPEGYYNSEDHDGFVSYAEMQTTQWWFKTPAVLGDAANAIYYDAYDCLSQYGDWTGIHHDGVAYICQQENIW